MKRDSKHMLYGLTPEQSSLKGIWLLCLLYFGSILSGAILSLIAFKITHAVDPDGSSYLAGKPYPNFLDRARWLSVLCLLPYLFIQCRLTNWKAIGFSRPALKTFLTWFSIGIPMILIIYGFNTLTGAFEFTWNTESILSRLLDAAVASFLIGSLEEIVFRGLVFRMFYTALRPLTAVLLSSFFFAVLHFKAPDFTLGVITPSEVGIAEAARIALTTAVAVFTQFDLKYLMAIFLVGVVLHQVFLITNNLWSSIAIHAGWVFTIKVFGKAFATTEKADAFSGTTNVADGYWVSIVLLVFIAGFGYVLHEKQTPAKLAS
ncbi:CPBP family intramembrane glutamic endopeptidase [Pelagicoccus albus]|uniref:CPBP family intramembrane metalloprotease n=1 Tax=Pelagicoccus albus TaxID=415222 RepID=A0A7X1BC42_9BACT|nr:CPBP family intramembrane glutamic endopeptidase [Pelagicoccus albus]MBC2608220.1 CPBP family intramembrane metalloprotease [Pelagicoccus albus]